MRKIKFRGRSIERGVYVYGEYYTVRKSDGSVLHMIDTTPEAMQEAAAVYPVDPGTVGEWTGLKDRNGVDIYEGDRVKCTLNTRRHEAIKGAVIFKNGSFGVKATDDSFYTFNVLALYVDRIEVTGVSGDD